MHRRSKAGTQFLLRIPAYCLLSAACSVYGLAQQPRSQPAAKPAPQLKPPALTNSSTEEPDAALAGDWAPELLDAILESPNLSARDALLDAAFAAGPDIVPQLEAALKDDRTAEFAAQSLAFMGGGKTLEILSRLLKDPRDLNLRRFYYGALGEFQNPQASQVLLYAVNRTDAEPDRTVTEAAILALTVRSDVSLVPQLKQAEAKIKDIVIRDDLENALDVIQVRARYLASPEGQRSGSSVEQAVRAYFIAALESVPRSVTAKSPATVPQAARTAAKVEVQNLTFSPNKTRVLAHVIFEDPAVMAYYSIVLQKQYGAWSVASVWLGSQLERPNLGASDQ